MLSKHHEVWLKDHPEYDEWWLSQAISAGFDVHHLDEDHDNNDPYNLVLIEKKDHSKLHGRTQACGDKARNRWENAKERIKLGESAYNIRLEEGYTWRKIAEMLGYYDGDQGTLVLNIASYYAKHNKKTWPIPHRPDCSCTTCVGKRRKAVK